MTLIAIDVGGTSMKAALVPAPSGTAPSGTAGSGVGAGGEVEEAARVAAEGHEICNEVHVVAVPEPDGEERLS